MTTKKQIHALLKHLLDRNDGLAISDSFVIVKPVRHVIRTLWIDRTSDADYPNFFWAVGHAFNPMMSRRGIWAEQFHVARGSPNRWSKPGMREAFTESAEACIVPMLRRVESFDDMFRIEVELRSHAYDGWLQYEPYQMQFHAANGNFDKAIAIYEAIKDWNRHPDNPRRRAYAFVTDDLAPLLLANDRLGVAALLHSWERATVKRNGLDAIYEPMPFPFELQQA